MTDFQSFSIVGNKGFRQLIKHLNPKYVLPCPKTLKILTNEKYKKQKEEVKKELLQVKNVNITTTLGRTTDTFFTITYRFNNPNFELKLCSIETSKIREN